NSSRTPAEVAAHLNGLGIAGEAEEVVNSAVPAVAQLADYLQPGVKVLGVGGNGVFEAIIEGGYELVTSAEDQPVAVLQGLSENVGWAQLSEAALAIKAGAKHFATNLDATVPKQRGEMLGNGSLVAAVANATGEPVIASGKPFEFIYRFAERGSGVTNALCVGDRLNTDIAGAVNANLPSLHVLTGVNTARDVVLATQAERPTYLALDLRALNEPYVRVASLKDGYECGETFLQLQATPEEIKITIDDEQIKLSATSTTLSAPAEIELNIFQYRALAQAVWDYLDNEGSAELISVLPEIKVVEGK
ncbi:MAG: HAD hydrolase-like protein, partial [Arcanobacterium sp.]|nr:HAD hydrolase-like protein [Arcanobacterium sp.]